MARQTINIGAQKNDHTGDTLRDAGEKINDNFAELYGVTLVDPNIAEVTATGTSTTNTLADWMADVETLRAAAPPEFVVLTQVEYDALSPPDPDIFYIITDSS